MRKTTSEPRARKGLRWWPAVVVVLLTSGALVWIRSRAELSFQERNLKSLAVLLGAALLLLVWWLTGSRTRWRLRLLVALAVAVTVGLSATCFRLRGVSGDLLPILEPS